MVLSGLHLSTLVMEIKAMSKLLKKWGGSLAIATVLALALSPLLTPFANAQSAPINIVGLDRLLKSIPVNVANATLSNDTAILIRYIGSQSGTVQVSAATLLLKDGPSGSEVATTDITGCGGTAGTLDQTNAGCDTMAEEVNRINASAKWRAVWLDAIGSDSTNGSVFTTLAATVANSPAGLAIKWDQTAVNFTITRAMVPYNNPVIPVTGLSPSYRTIAPYLNAVDSSRIVERPFNDVRTFLYYFSETTTFGSGTSTIQFLDCDTHYRPTALIAGGSVESCSVVYQAAGGATTVNKTLTDFEFNPFVFTQGNRALVRVVNSAANSAAPLMVASGYQIQYR